MQALSISIRSGLSSNNSLDHASESFVVEHSHKGNHQNALILSTLKQIVIVLELPCSILLSGVFLLKLFFRVEVDLNFNIIDKIVSKIFSSLSKGEYLVFLRDVELRHHHFYYPTSVSLEVYHEFSFFLMSNQFIEPVTTEHCYFRFDVLAAIESQCADTFCY